MSKLILRKPNPTPDPNLGGRPSEYRTAYAYQARGLCLLGATLVELAEYFQVAEATVKNWMNAHPEFLAAIKEGRQGADARVVDSLYQRAIGYDHVETKVFTYLGEVITYDVMKHYPPDVTAQIFWLKNRRPDLWRDKHEVSGPDGGPIPIEEVKWNVIPVNGNGNGKVELQTPKK